MTSITLTITGARAWATVTGPLTSGMVGIPVTIEYDDAWDGLIKNLVCRCSMQNIDSEVHRTILNVENTAVVAHEVMRAGMLLYLGVEGCSADGTLVIPTVWARCGVIERGANAGADFSADPTLPVWGQLQAEIGQIKNDAVTQDQMAGIQAGIQSATQAAAVSAGRAEAAAKRAEEAANGGAEKLSPISKTADMIQPVGVDEEGRLWTAPTAGGVMPDEGGGSGGGDDPGGEDVVTEQTEALTAVWGGFIDAATFEVTTNANYASAGFSTLKANRLRFQWNPGESNAFQVAILQFDADGNPYKTSNVSAYSSAPITDGAGFNNWRDPGDLQYAAIGGGDITIDLPATGSVGVILRRSSATGTDSNAKFGAWLQDGGLTITAIYSAVTTVDDIMTIDEDYAMDYGAAPASLVTDGASSTKTEIAPAYAAVIEQAKNAWMLEANGDIDKIPLIIHTDQHGSMNGNNKLFPFLAEIVNWYDVSKVINLGDTMSFWSDSDPEHPWHTCAGLEAYLEAMSDVPFSRRIEVYGNHDTWNSSYETAENQAYLSKYFRNIYARRADNYGNFVVKDDNYNVKYVIVSGFAYDSGLGGHTHYVIHPDAIRWVISELEKADGYDVILLSHIPLGSTSTTVYNPVDGTTAEQEVSGINYRKLTDLWRGRKAKISGTVTDEYGTVYDFDFTGCDGDLLCGLHGHEHADGYYYIGDLMDAYFDGHLHNRAAHFVLVDRKNRRLNVWKTDNTPNVQNYQIPFDKPTV